MRVLVAGATGTLGLAAVRALVAGGHAVVGLVRSREKGAPLHAVGAEAVVGDVLDRSLMRAAARGTDAVVHLAASEEDFERTRVEGCRNLVDAGVAEGARRFLLGSGYWIFGHHEGAITEDSAIDEQSAGRVNWTAECVALEHADDLDILVARPGMVYGPGSWFARMVAMIREGSYRVIGDGANRWSPVHPADVGEAFRAILERGETRNVYLVVDDEPVTVREFVSFVAAQLGVPAPASVSRKDAEGFAGPEIVRAMTANQAASNAKLRSLGWRPRFPTYREGVPDVLRAMQGT